MRAGSALGSYHWLFLAQPAPMPERLIGADPAFYVRHTLSSWAASRSLAAFDPAALSAYETALGAPERVHAVCEDYRAGAGVDRRLDEQDRIDGRAIGCPTLVVWGSDYVGKGAAHPLEVWRAWAERVEGCEVRSGHFLAEENPADTLAALMPFLLRVRGEV
jgi:haloacetate dehalogenase